MINNILFSKIIKKINNCPGISTSSFEFEDKTDSGDFATNFSIKYNEGIKTIFNFKIGVFKTEVPKNNFQIRTDTHDFKIECHQIPGSINEYEYNEVYGSDSLLIQIEEWLNLLVKNEEENINLHDYFEFQSDFFRNINDNDEEFTEEEREDLSKRLDKLEKQIKESIKKQDIDKDQLEDQIFELRELINSLKSDIFKMNRSKWIKLFVDKIIYYTLNSNVITVEKTTNFIKNVTETLSILPPPC